MAITNPIDQFRAEILNLCEKAERTADAMSLIADKVNGAEAIEIDKEADVLSNLAQVIRLAVGGH